MTTLTKDNFAMDIRNHALRYGNILDDVSWQDNGNNYRTTFIELDGKQLHVSMRNGDVVFLKYK